MSNTLKDEANAAYQKFESFEHSKNGWYSSEDGDVHDQLYKEAQDKAYYALAKGVSSNNLDFFL